MVTVKVYPKNKNLVSDHFTCHHRIVITYHPKLTGEKKDTSPRLKTKGSVDHAGPSVQLDLLKDNILERQVC